MRRALAVAVAAVAAALIGPGAAEARDCSTKRGTKSILFEDPAVQVFARRYRQRYYRDIVACSRLTGRVSEIGSESKDPNGRDSLTVEGVLAGRYLWTSESSSAAESVDVERHQLFDLRTRRKVQVVKEDEDTRADLAAAPGALFVADGAQLVRHGIDGGRTVLDQGQGVVAPAAAPTVLYWRNGETTRSVPLPAAEPAPEIAHPARPARRREPCLPRGRTALLRDFGIVVSRGRSGRVAGCRLGTRQRYDLGDAVLGSARRALSEGPPEGFRALDRRRLLYRLPVTADGGVPGTAVAVLDLRSGDIHNGGGRQFAGLASLDRVVTYADGASLFSLERSGPRELARGEAPGEIALGETDIDLYRRFLYWTDGGEPKALEP